MKKVITGKDLQEKILESLNLLCETVGSTLGPKGSNVIIDHSLFSPFITNDGATIASNIESEDEVINTILEITKEASLKTNELVGDGTSSTLVLLQAIYSNSLEYVNKGLNPIYLKRLLDEELTHILKLLEQEKKSPSKETLEAIASIAANDSEIGHLVSKVYEKVKKKEAITLKEVETNTLSFKIQKGYTFSSTLPNKLFLKEKKKQELKRTAILLLDDDLLDLECISSILNYVDKRKINLVLIANNFSESVIQELVSLTLDDDLACIPLKLESFGTEKNYLYTDLAFITKAKICSTDSWIKEDSLGYIDSLSYTDESTTINFAKTKDLQKYIAKLEALRKEKNTLDEEIFFKRIAMLSKGLAVIEVGGPTKTEMHEKKMRIEDAICAYDAAKDGVVLGGGITFLKIASSLKENTIQEKIFLKSLEKPFFKLMDNAGMNKITVKEEIEESNYQILFNIKENRMEDIKTTKVIDPLKVIKNILINATSIATMLLTTSSLVINEYKNSFNKEGEYTEI